MFGDIGTSPLYSIKETFSGLHHSAPAPVTENIVGVLSLVFWSLVLVVGVKYIRFVMRADNNSEGGILALTALIRPGTDEPVGSTKVLVLLGLFGAALLYGDGMITPAISVLSAVEGTAVATHSLEDWVVPIAALILFGIFSIQRRGTAAVGRAFGPVMIVWFSVIGLLGLSQVVRNPGVLRAVNPIEGAQFFANNGATGFLTLGSIILVVTGGEALYADMGHFGRRPITIAWYTVVLPGLLLCYFGQGAMLMEHPDRVENPFFLMAPRWALWPVVLLATCATVIAAQALISGAFSLTKQAVALGYLPRVRITHTSEDAQGQIYVPAVNWALFVACIGLVFGFRSSGNLAAAYGLAVAGTMVVTTILFYRVARERFGWGPVASAALCGLFLTIDVAYLAANIPKIPAGGWFPIVIGVAVCLMLTTWYAGRRITAVRLVNRNVLLEEFIARVAARGDAVRGPGIGVYMGSNPATTPQALSSHYRHAAVLPEHVCPMAVLVQDVPHVPREEQLEVIDHGHGFVQLLHRVGFMDDIDIPLALKELGTEQTGLDFANASYVLGRETLRVTRRPGMAPWRERLFVLMLRNANPADAYFRLPPEQTIELGVQVEL